MQLRVRALALTLLTCAMFGVAASSAYGQGLTGQITGTVVDNSKAVLPGVTVTAKNAATQTTREAVTDGSGEFTIPNLLAGTYTVTATLPGFKTYERSGVALTATERLDLPEIILELGGVSETVQVTSEAAAIQTRSGERSAVITSNDLDDRGLKGRDPLGTLMTLPGVVDTSNRDAPGTVGGLTINGQSSIAFAYDGITSKDTGANGGNFARPALDSIAQIKVQASNFQAEYGRSSGATIVVVTKSGSRDFRGSFAYFRRDDAYNSNSWERERDCAAGQTASCEPPQYNYNNTTYTIGGPVILPGSWNANRDKLFFFWSHDMLPRTDPGNLSQINMPTEKERRGDFSETRDSQNRLVFIKDPAIAGGTCAVNTGAGNACFVGNVIPQNRISPIAAIFLNPTLLPLPNTTDPTGRNQYNYTYQNVEDKPRFDHTLRIDWNAGPSTTFYSRLQIGRVKSGKGYSSSLGSSGNGGWPQFYTSGNEQSTESWVNTLLHTFNPTTVMEITAGVNWAAQNTYIIDETGGLDVVGSYSRNKRATAMPTLPDMLFGGSGNPLDMIPNVSWEGSNALNGTPSYSFESRFPFTARDDIHNLAANLTKLKGSHNMKVGMFLEYTKRPASRSSSFNGTYNFNATTDNPIDSNFGLANLLLGNLNSYQESDIHPYAQGRYKQFEFFAQDNWRLKRNFTLDYGLRVYYIGPTYVAGQQIATFQPGAYSTADADRVELYQPTCANGAATCSGAQRVAANPAGGVLPAFYIGKVIPGSGNLDNGIVIGQETPYKGVWRPAPRVGFAWDVTGDGKTAIRGGAGVFYDRYSDDTILTLVQPRPLVLTRTYNFVNVAAVAGAVPVDGIVSGSAFTADFKPPTVYNWSIGVQRELPWRLVADIAYVGNAGRNNGLTIPINDLDYGTRRIDLNPSAADPTRNNTQAKDDFVFRRIVGYSGISERVWQGSNNYHSIQISVNRRLANGFAFGVSYTGSTRSSLGTFDPFLTEEQNRLRNTSASGSRPHNLVVNYNYLVPRASALMDNAIIRGVGDGWQVTGVSTFQSGTRTGFSAGYSPSLGDTRGTGGPGGARVTMVCDPNLPKGERTETRQFRTECIKMPGPSTVNEAQGGYIVHPDDIYWLGNALGDEWVNLGYVNHDLSLFKNFAMGAQRNLQVRIEFYNLFNTVQWSGVDTSATFNPNTGEQTDTNFGTVTGTRTGSARIIQLGVRFTF